MNALRLQAMDMLAHIPDAMIVDVIEYLTKMQASSIPSKQSRTLDFSKYTRKGSVPLGMDAQKWVEELRSNDRI